MYNIPKYIYICISNQSLGIIIPKTRRTLSRSAETRHGVDARHKNPAFEEAADEVCSTNQALRQGMLDSRNHIHQLSD